MAQPAGDAGGLVARAEIEIGARRPDDRAAGVLRDHQPAEPGVRLQALDRQIGRDEERRAVGVQLAVDRDRAARRQRDALGADRLLVGGQMGLAEEHIGLVAPPQLLALLGIALHPFADAVHRHFVLGHDLAVDQTAADRVIGMAVRGLIVQPHQLAVVEHARAPSPGCG